MCESQRPTYKSVARGATDTHHFLRINPKHTQEKRPRDMSEIAFRSHHNTFLAVIEGHLTAEHHVSGNSKFIVTKHHHQFTLQTHHGESSVRRGSECRWAPADPLLARDCSDSPTLALRHGDAEGRVRTSVGGSPLCKEGGVQLT